MHEHLNVCNFTKPFFNRHQNVSITIQKQTQHYLKKTDENITAKPSINHHLRANLKLTYYKTTEKNKSQSMVRKLTLY